MDNDKKSRGFNPKASFLGALIGIVGSCILWIVCAILLYTGALSPGMLPICSYASLAIGTLTGAFAASMGSGVRLLNAVCVAAIMMIFFIIVGLFLKNTAFSAISCFIVLIISLISAIIGSVISTIFR